MTKEKANQIVQKLLTVCETEGVDTVEDLFNLLDLIFVSTVAAQPEIAGAYAASVFTDE